MRAGCALGYNMAGTPLFAIEAVAWSWPAGAFDGLLLGSANAVRCAGEALQDMRALPVYAVGSATAAAAKAAGLHVAYMGEGGLQNLLDALSGTSLRLLRLGGEDRVSLLPPAGITLADIVIYRARALGMPAPLITELGLGGCVLLHSARAASHFAAQCDVHGIPRSTITLCTLGTRIADAAGTGWRHIAVPAEMTDAALLALAADIIEG